MESQKLKLGLLLDSYDVPAWFYHSIQRIVDLNCAEFSIVVLNDGSQKTGSSTSFNKSGGNRGKGLYELFNKIDEKIFYREPNPFKAMNLQEMLAGIPVLKVKTSRQGNTDFFISEDVQVVRDCKTELLIKHGFEQVGGEILSAAKYGVWFYDHCDNRLKRGGPPGFWEVVESLPETGAALSIANEDFPGGQVIYRSHFLTYPFSPARNRSTSFWAASSFLPRQIDLLYRLGEARFFQETAKYNNGFDFYDGKPYQVPTNFESLRLYSRLLGKFSVELYKRAFNLVAWHLMFDFSNNAGLAFSDFKKIESPKDRFWADPHVIQKDGKYFIFVEEYPYKNRKGHISFIEMDAEGQYKDSVPVLETDYHLSYPFVFEHDQHYYMVPESAQHRTIDLYECVEFPSRWKFKMTLMDNVRAVDTTLFFHNGKWWLFSGITENMGAHPEVELFLYYSDDLFTTEWKSHPLNPVISDVTCARPAGKLFTKDGKIYRPSQDCSKNYGNGFNINEIVCLSETEYVEKKVATVKPNWDKKLIAAHTYTCGDGIVIIDALTRPGKFF